MVEKTAGKFGRGRFDAQRGRQEWIESALGARAAVRSVAAGNAPTLEDMKAF